MRPTAERIGDEVGASTVLAALMIAALVSITYGGVWLGSVVVAQHRAQAAADLSALAGARRLAAGADAVCRQVAAVSAAMRAAVHHCAIERLDVVVTVGVRVGGPVAARVRASARAGPARGG